MSVEVIKNGCPDVSQYCDVRQRRTRGANNNNNNRELEIVEDRTQTNTKVE